MKSFMMIICVSLFMMSCGDIEQGGSFGGEIGNNTGHHLIEMVLEFFYALEYLRLSQITDGSIIYILVKTLSGEPVVRFTIGEFNSLPEIFEEHPGLTKSMRLGFTSFCGDLNGETKTCFTMTRAGSLEIEWYADTEHLANEIFNSLLVIPSEGDDEDVSIGTSNVFGGSLGL